MKIAIVMTLLLVAFSAVALAEKPIEGAALDFIVPRGDCGWIFSGCTAHSQCCEGWFCVRSLCRYRLK
uniref:U24-Sparatoxin-Hju1ar_1 n=1 Tax=Heteropoda jugulans TaxID=1358901 RepID=A0A4Q8KC47_9ARAC